MKTKIPWTEESWNPIRGCSHASSGCDNCYAEKMAARFSKAGQPFHGFAHMALFGDGERRARWTRRVSLVPKKLAEPFRWKEPRLVFLNSMSDLFHQVLPIGDVAAVLCVVAFLQRHTFQVLTKRAERMRDLMNHLTVSNLCGSLSDIEEGTGKFLIPADVKFESLQGIPWPLPNLWLGVSVENRRALRRIESLRGTPAALRFVSFEPLLEDLGKVDFTGIDWAIIGGENGPRECDPDWIRSIRDQAFQAGARVFIKQLGSHWARHRYALVKDRKSGRRSLRKVGTGDRKGAAPQLWPEDLRVFQFPDRRSIPTN